MKRFSLTAIFVVTLTGCATQSNMAWTKPSASSQEFYQARAQCTSMAGPGGQQIMNGGNGGGAFGSGFNQGYNQMSAVLSQNRQKQIFNDCMRGQGWRLERR